MPDPFRKVQPNDPVEFTATTWNAMLDAAQAEQGRRLDMGGDSQVQSRSSALVKVRNDSGRNLERNTVLELAGPIFSPETSLDAFLRDITFVGIVPTGNHTGRFAILLDPVVSGGVTRAWISGVCAVKVSQVDSSHTCAEASSGNTSALESSENGSAQILWIDTVAYDSTFWALVRMGTSCSGTGSSGKCECRDGPYEIDVICGDCAGYYGGTKKMPKYWWITITAADDWPYGGGYGYDNCELPCHSLMSAKIRLTYEGIYSSGCTWSGKEARCLQGELTIDGDYWKITLTDRNACVLAILRKPIEAFICCGSNTGWTAETDIGCNISVSLDPDPCTCCPQPPTCPPEGKPICLDTPCCVSDCNITITVGNLYTPSALACTMFDLDCTHSDGSSCNFGDADCFRNRPSPNQCCGGMNGVYPMTWDADCHWGFSGVPGGGSVKVSALLSLHERIWNFSLLGPDGQTAVFELTDWDCNNYVDMIRTGGSCPIMIGQNAIFTLDMV